LSLSPEHTREALHGFVNGAAGFARLPGLAFWYSLEFENGSRISFCAYHILGRFGAVF